MPYKISICRFNNTCLYVLLQYLWRILVLDGNSKIWEWGESYVFFLSIRTRIRWLSLEENPWKMCYVFKRLGEEFPSLTLWIVCSQTQMVWLWYTYIYLYIQEIGKSKQTYLFSIWTRSYFDPTINNILHSFSFVCALILIQRSSKWKSSKVRLDLIYGWGLSLLI